MLEVKLSVRDLVAYVYKGGDLSSEAISVQRALEGTRIHKLLQSQGGPEYNKEYYLKHVFTYNDIDFIVEGRADGIIIKNESVTIDEIKSTYADLNIIDEKYNYAHSAQALCYAYIYSYEEKLKNVLVQVRYCNIETLETKVLLNEYSFEELEKFFYELIDSYLEWAKLNVTHAIEKRKTIEEIDFPFLKYRRGQRELLIAVYQTIKNRNKLFVQAPTGVGKTISVIFPAIKAINKIKGAKIYYLTSKSSTKQIAEKTIKILNDKGLRLRATIITAKEKICMNDEVLCEAEHCVYAKGYFNRINDALIDAMKCEYIYNRDYIEKLAKKYCVCPFELSLELCYLSDIVICDYNYYFDPRVALKREDFNKNTNDILLIDEAHNLEDRARNMYSCELVKEEFYEVYKQIKDISQINKDIKKLFKNINSQFIEFKKSIVDENNKVLMEEPDELLKLLRKLIKELDKWMLEKKGYDNKQLEDIYFKCLFFIKLSELYDENFCYYISKSNKEFKIKIFLVNTSEVLREILKNAYSAIFFSATLTPLRYYKQILGGDVEKDKIISMNSPFNIENLGLSLVGNLSMKYNVRDLNIESICSYINTVINIKKGNYMVFFPSYVYLNKVIQYYQENYDDELVINISGIDENEQFKIIEKFRNENNVVLFTVVGGVFSEGVNLPLDRLIGAIVIGTGIPQISFERNIIKDFFDNKYNCGFDFAYKFPGFNKILQSVGRVIRTEEDRGIALLIDSRITEASYRALFPYHWRNFKIIYNNNQLIEQLKKFWIEGEMK